MGHCSLGVVVRRAVVKGKAGVAGGGKGRRKEANRGGGGKQF